MLECALVFRRQGKNVIIAEHTSRHIEEIFIVPVCSILAQSPASYIAFLEEEGALARALAIVAAANLKQPRTAELTRRKVRALVTEAEVKALAPQINTITDALSCAD